MGLAREFEELKIWQDARIQANRIYDAFGNCRDFGFRDQLHRAGVSAMNNIAEGFERETRPEFARFLAVAKGSCGEVRSMLHLSQDRGFMDPPEAKEMIACAKQLSRSIKAFSKSLG